MTDQIHRTDLCRSAPFHLLRAEPDADDGLTIEGYGAVFNSVTQINSWEGDFEEVIAPGAFRKSLREQTLKMQFDHGRHPLLGSVPLGRWTTAEEDTRGLHLVGRLTDNWLTTPFRDAIRDGGVEGMSFRFTVGREEWVDRDGKKLREDELFDLLWRGAGDRGPLRRTLKEVRASEAGPVVWPAYSDTEVGVRTRDDGTRIVVLDLGRLRERNPTELVRLARLVAITDRDTEHDTEHDTDRDDDIPDVTETTAETAVEHDTQHDPEPRSTERSADEHPEPEGSAQPVTDPSAGEHSSPAIAVSPIARRDDIRSRFREVTDRWLSLPSQN